MPISSLLDTGLALSWAIALPPNSTRRLELRSVDPSSTIVCTSDFFSAAPCWVNVTLANAVRRSALTCPLAPVTKGLATLPTAGCFAIVPSTPAILVRTAVSVRVPVAVWKTTVSVSPDWARRLPSFSRLNAFVESVPGSWKASEYAVPDEELMIARAASTATHAPTTT